ncbi:MAG: YicC family protein [Candidatus Marinimicrobia bacterium]|nr:YicC family protein [Candidatus Neomarinimicrobiota bacterium]MDD5581801.1 YicC family protein [Candidatus Neomarinimicrobiota bacterium]
MLSMTGFGKAEGVYQDIQFTVEIQSVNSRYLDISTFIPRKVSFLENPVRDFLQKTLHRGKIVYSLNLTGDLGEISHFQLNEKLLESLLFLKDILKKKYQVKDTLSVSDILMRDDIIELMDSSVEEEAFLKEILMCSHQAIEQLETMEKQEGDYLKKQFIHDLEDLKQEITSIENLQKSNLENHISAMKKRVKALMNDVSVDEGKIYQEIVFMADKLDISEEIQRFKSHLLQFETYLNENSSVGKRLNFLLQELHREINTLGNKVANALISQRVVEIKNKLEIIREQVQNIQ